MSRIDLLWMGGGEPPAWGLGAVSHHALLEPAAAEAFLFWDGALGVPDGALMTSLLDRPADVWHAGLRQGMGGRPGMLDFVQPTWMLNRDPDPEIEATSWRLSLRACLVRSEVVGRLGGPRGDFDSIGGASLELGHRYIAGGARVRHVPWMVERADAGAVALSTADAGRVRLSPAEAGPDGLSLADELRFLRLRFGRRWARWALGRALVTGYASAASLRRAWNATRDVAGAPGERLYEREPGRAGTASVSVLIPTLDRYPYLRTLLDQLRDQTLRPEEIIVVDQTPADRREALPAFPDLPLRVLYRDRPGQCSSRNDGLNEARGDLILMLDDDDEVPADLVERHLEALGRFGADASCGVADEHGAGPLPEAFERFRTSDVLPANNTMIRREALERAGLFDLAYEHAERADLDLGMRLYLSGALLMLNPSARVVHHHAPRGGLREHGARVVTYASSRQRITHRHLPSVSELYFARRYFPDGCRREAVWLRLFGTLAGRGGAVRRAGKAFAGIALLPGSLRTILRRDREAAAWMERFPEIPALEPVDLLEERG